MKHKCPIWGCGGTMIRRGGVWVCVKCGYHAKKGEIRRKRRPKE